MADLCGISSDDLEKTPTHYGKKAVEIPRFAVGIPRKAVGNGNKEKKRALV
jgi:hypothetical protein